MFISINALNNYIILFFLKPFIKQNEKKGFFKFTILLPYLYLYVNLFFFDDYHLCYDTF